MGYNKQQTEIINQNNTSLLVLSSPGTGKTHTAVGKIASLVKGGMPSDKVLAITFTEDAANELKERLVKQLGDDGTNVKAGTFHSWALEMLKRFSIIPKDTLVISEKEQCQIFTEMGMSAEESGRMVQLVGKIKDSATVEGASASYVYPATQNYSADEIKSFVKRYDDAKGQKLDFSDILIKTVQALNNKDIRSQAAKYSYIVLDEAQDSNPIQLQLLDRVMNSNTKLDAFGDENQSIYGWRGAVPEAVKKFMAEHGAKILKLTETYRCPVEICSIASSLMGAMNQTEIDGIMFNPSGKSCGLPEVCYSADRFNEIKGVCDKVKELLNSGFVQLPDGTKRKMEARDIVVEARTNAEVREIIEALKKAQLPVSTLKRQNPYHNQELQDFMTVLKTARGNANNDKLALLSCMRYFRIDTEPFEQDLNSAQVPRFSQILAKGKGPFGVVSLKRGEEMEEIRQLMLSINEKIKAGSMTAAAETLLKAYRGEKENLALLEWVVKKDFAGKTYDEVFETFARKSKDEAVNDVRNTVKVTTIHLTKGLEWPVVFLTGQSQSALGKKDLNNETLKAEKQLVYVGITRSSQNLYITASNKTREQSVPTLSKVWENVDPSFFNSAGLEKLKAEEAVKVFQIPVNKRDNSGLDWMLSEVKKFSTSEKEQGKTYIMASIRQKEAERKKSVEKEYVPEVERENSRGGRV